MVGDVISETKHEKIADEYKLFTEKRVGSDENIVLNRVGIALSLMQKPGKFKRDAEIKIAVGLPEEYDLYASTLIDQLSGYHEFELQIAKRRMDTCFIYNQGREYRCFKPAFRNSFKHCCKPKRGSN